MKKIKAIYPTVVHQWHSFVRPVTYRIVQTSATEYALEVLSQDSMAEDAWAKLATYNTNNNWPELLDGLVSLVFGGE